MRSDYNTLRNIGAGFPQRRGNTGPIAFASIAALFALAGCRGEMDGGAVVGAQSPPAAIAVQTSRVTRKDVSRLLSLPSDLLPWQEATLYSKVPGTLDSILVDRGDSVRAGQLLAVIRAPEIVADAEQARQNMLAAEQSARIGAMTELKSDSEAMKARASAEKAAADYSQARPAVSRAASLVKQALAAQYRAEDQKRLAESSLAESKAQTAKAAAGLDAADADQRLARVTFDRYNGIYLRDAKLIAKQQVDETESRMLAAASRSVAARGELEAARQRERSAETQITAATHQVDEARAGVEAARQQVAYVQAQSKSLQKQAESARRDIDVAKRQQDVSRAQEQQALLAAKALKAANTRSSDVAEFTRIRAPFNGIVTKRQADTGAFIQSASSSQNAQPILTVADRSRLRLDIHVPESEARFVRVGIPVELQIGENYEPIKAKVSRTTGALDTKTRTLLAEVDVPNTTGALLPGAYVTARITLETHPAVLSLPSAAIGADKSGRFVFVVIGGKAKRLPVTIGFDTGAVAEIADGLSGGEETVVIGRDNITAGSIVTTSPWTPKKPKKDK